MPPATPRHDHDAGGDRATLEAKAELRELAWARIREAEAARFCILAASASPGSDGGMPSSADSRCFSVALMASQLLTTVSASSASTSPNTCG